MSPPASLKGQQQRPTKASVNHRQTSFPRHGNDGHKRRYFPNPAIPSRAQKPIGRASCCHMAMVATTVTRRRRAVAQQPAARRETHLDLQTVAVWNYKAWLASAVSIGTLVTLPERSVFHSAGRNLISRALLRGHKLLCWRQLQLFVHLKSLTFVLPPKSSHLLLNACDPLEGSRQRQSMLAHSERQQSQACHKPPPGRHVI